MQKERGKLTKCSQVTLGFGTCRTGARERRKRLTGLYIFLTCVNFHKVYNLNQEKNEILNVTSVQNSFVIPYSFYMTK